MSETKRAFEAYWADPYGAAPAVPPALDAEGDGKAAGMSLTLTLCDAWFDHEGGATRLRVATDQRGAPESFECRLSFLPARIVSFARIADIKGRRVYEATRVRLVDDPDPSLRDLTWRPRGPFRKGPSDVA